jgi:hypothetical protein
MVGLFGVFRPEGQRGRHGLDAPVRFALVPTSRQLLFDFGGPMLFSPFELAVPGAASMGLEPTELGGGPFDRHDARWAARTRGEITERDYWAGEAAAGLAAVWFDITDPIGSLARVRAALDRTGADRP